MVDTCPECDEPYVKVTEVDARPGGALFEDYVHEIEERSVFNEITDSCHHIIEWGEESDHAAD
jgi:hypothetical protein